MKTQVYAVWSLAILVGLVMWFSLYDPNFLGAQENEGVNVTIVSDASTLGNKAYQPNSLQISLGSTVMWTNDDFGIHTVTEDEGSFSSEPLRPDDVFTYTFNKVGTYGYHCDLHPTMVGSIKVL